MRLAGLAGLGGLVGLPVLAALADLAVLWDSQRRRGSFWQRIVIEFRMKPLACRVVPQCIRGEPDGFSLLFDGVGKQFGAA
jgi:hypothetical protein